MKLLQLSYSALQSYRKTKGNENITFKEARAKLTRNVELAVESVENAKDTGNTLFKYGNLWILVNEVKHKIIWIHNWKGKKSSEGWQQNEFLKYLASEDYGVRIS